MQRAQRDQGPVKVLPLAGLHLQLGCHPAPAHGWSMPLWYEGALDEQEQTRRGAGVFDCSYLGRFYVTGEGADAALDRVLATDPRRAPAGRVHRALYLREDGTVQDVVTLCHLEQGRWLVVTGPRGSEALRSDLQSAARAALPDVQVQDRVHLTALVALEGPRAADVFGEVFGPRFLESVPREGCRELLLGHHRAAVARTSQVGEDGFSIVLAPEDGGEIWRRFLQEGAVSAGLLAHDALRLEAGVLEAPAETPAPATPEAAGLGDLVDLESREFPGAEALRSAGPSERRVTGLRLEGPRLARAGSRVLLDGRDIGACVNGGYSPALHAGVAIAYLPPGVNLVEVDTDGQWTPAHVMALPFVPSR